MRRKLAVLFITVLLTSCSNQQAIRNSVYPTLNDGRYDSEFPYQSSSLQLEKISNSIRLINSIAFYKSYFFDHTRGIKIVDVPKLEVEETASRTDLFNQNSSGTGTVIFFDDRSIALLTCAHVVNFEDTIFTFYSDASGRVTDIIESISIKMNQNNYTNLKNGELEIMAIDNKLDLAIVGNYLQSGTADNPEVFNYPAGEAKELEWGSFVYVFGYPYNYKMLTRGIVSSPNRNENGEFLLDVMFHRGASGGLVLAVRDGVPNFEFVGIIKSIPATYEYNLIPDVKELEKGFSPAVPYTGSFYVERRANAQVGITKVIPVEEILSFIEDHKSELGFSIKDIFEKN
ncbi:MAG: serine protease [Melioribacteraceae bacterium]|nr:serine protease [Melioribacteraceae bacterium]MCF8263998.1 serine protease [Melioribacteraceae bacterium]